MRPPALDGVRRASGLAGHIGYVGESNNQWFDALQFPCGGINLNVMCLEP